MHLRHRINQFLRRRIRDDQKDLINKRSFLIVFFFCVGNALIVNTGFYQPYAAIDMDRLTRFAPEVPPATGIRPAAVVLVHDDEFRQYFGGKLPLSPAPLLNVVRTLCQLHVARIGVDVFSDLWLQPGAATQMTPQQLDAAMADLGDCPIVWIRAAQETRDESGKYLGTFALGGVLGRDAPAQGICTALPVFERDFDNVVRQDRSWVPAGVAATDVRPYATMAEALRSPGRDRCGFITSSDTKPKPVNIGYRKDREIVRLSFSDFYFDGPESQRQSFYESKRALASNLRLGPETIVLLGAAYADARDQYSTPLREMYGTEILANAAIGKPVNELSFWLGCASDVIVSCLITFAVSFCRTFRLRSFLSIVFSLVIAFLLAWVLFTRFNIFTGVYTSLFGSIIAVMGGPVWDQLMKDPVPSWPLSRHRR